MQTENAGLKNEAPGVRSLRDCLKLHKNKWKKKDMKENTVQVSKGRKINGNVLKVQVEDLWFGKVRRVTRREFSCLFKCHEGRRRKEDSEERKWYTR